MDSPITERRPLSVVRVEVGVVGVLRDDFTSIMIISDHHIIIFVSSRRLISQGGFVFSVKVKSKEKL